MAHRVPARVLGGATILVAFLHCHALAPALADNGTVVRITARDCQRLSEYVPDPGVAYQPGIDVQGQPVTPAELGGAPQLSIPETTTIAIEVDLQDRFGFPANKNSFEGSAQIGIVEVDPDGRARFNGQPLQDEEQAELARRCQEILYGQN